MRAKAGRSPDPTVAITDSQSARAAANIPRTTSGWDGGKKVGGRKRHLVVDCLGLVLAVLVTAADVQDRDAAVPLLQPLRSWYFALKLVWKDGGYAGHLVDWATERLQLTLEIVKRSDDTAGFVVLPRRRVVDRTLSWLMRCGPASPPGPATPRSASPAARPRRLERPARTGSAGIRVRAPLPRLPRTGWAPPSAAPHHGPPRPGLRAVPS
ncbi:transposase [Streptomyces sp. cg2]|uniref:transposase n=1 Tax=Streptomyces sp. cg2 TaxID=3238799 RepID=UPI0034E2FFED